MHKYLESKIEWHPNSSLPLKPLAYTKPKSTVVTSAKIVLEQKATKIKLILVKNSNRNIGNTMDGCADSSERHWTKFDRPSL